MYVNQRHVCHNSLGLNVVSMMRDYHDDESRNRKHDTVVPVEALAARCRHDHISIYAAPGAQQYDDASWRAG